MPMSRMSSEKNIFRVEPADRIAARALKAHREQLDLSEHELARLSGIKVRDIVQYESGKHQVPMSVLFTLAPFLGMDIDAALQTLVCGEEDVEENGGGEALRLVETAQ